MKKFNAILAGIILVGFTAVSAGATPIIIPMTQTEYNDFVSDSDNEQLAISIFDLGNDSIDSSGGQESFTTDGSSSDYDNFSSALQPGTSYDLEFFRSATSSFGMNGSDGSESVSTSVGVIEFSNAITLTLRQGPGGFAPFVTGSTLTGNSVSDGTSEVFGDMSTSNPNDFAGVLIAFPDHNAGFQPAISLSTTFQYEGFGSGDDSVSVTAELWKSTEVGDMPLPGIPESSTLGTFILGASLMRILRRKVLI
jgi:hypothetical protein